MYSQNPFQHTHTALNTHTHTHIHLRTPSNTHTDLLEHKTHTHQETHTRVCLNTHTDMVEHTHRPVNAHTHLNTHTHTSLNTHGCQHHVLPSQCCVFEVKKLSQTRKTRNTKARPPQSTFPQFWQPQMRSDDWYSHHRTTKKNSLVASPGNSKRDPTKDDSLVVSLPAPRVQGNCQLACPNCCAPQHRGTSMMVAAWFTMNVITGVFGSIACLMLASSASFSTQVNPITRCTAFYTVPFAAEWHSGAVLQLHLWSPRLVSAETLPVALFVPANIAAAHVHIRFFLPGQSRRS